MPETIQPLGLEFCATGQPLPRLRTTTPAWDSLIDHADKVPVDVLLLLVKVLAAAAGAARLWEHALGTSKVHRPLAQKVLEKLPDCPRRLFETLASRDSQARKAAAEWIARLKPEGAAEALRSALQSEKSTPVKGER